MYTIPHNPWSSPFDPINDLQGFPPPTDWELTNITGPNLPYNPYELRYRNK